MNNLQYTFFWGLVLAILAGNAASSQGQKLAVQGDFIPPLDIPLVLAGNFGEIRSNHFHSGLDFKTNATVGYRVYSVDEGYISRIKVEPGGYGKAVYIEHPSGYTSVYGHLLKFRSDIEEYVRAQQYAKESFGVDLYFKPGRLALKKGDFFALSGNTGSSQAPHLHFEIRDSQSQNPLNPLNFNFKVSDKTPPLIKSLYLYGLEGRKDLKVPVKVEVKGSSGLFYPVKNKVYPVDALAGIGIETIDFLDDAPNPCGVYEIEVYIDDILQSRIRMNEFGFTESRYINSLIDYKKYKKNNQQVIKTFIDPNNHLSIYEFSRNRGKFSLDMPGEHLLSINVMDVHGNTSNAKIRIASHPEVYENIDYSTAFYSAYFSYAETNRFESEGMDLYVAPNTLYDDLYFQYESTAMGPQQFSRVHHVHNPYTPLHRGVTLRIQPDSLPAKLKNKALIARINENGYMAALGGNWDGDMLSVQTAVFGSFVVAVDTIAPQIIPAFNQDVDPLNPGKEIRFRIRDNFSGISTFRGTVNGKYILFEYDAKSGTLTHETDPAFFPSGETVELKLLVKDQVGNASEFKKKVLRK